MVRTAQPGSPRAKAFAAWGIALAALAWSGGATASTIPPGREAVVQEIVAAAARSSGAPAPKSIAIDREVIRVRLSDERGALRELVIHEPGSKGGKGGLAEGVHLLCEPACSAAEQEGARALAAALAAGTARASGRLWTSPGAPGEPVGIASTPARAYATWLALAYVILWGAARAAEAVKRAGLWRTARGLAAPLAIIAASAFASLALTERTPVHDHNSFVARSDCAYALSCDKDPRGGAWGPPTFHAYAVFLRALPYRVENLSVVSTALTALALLLLFLFTRAFFARVAGEGAGAGKGAWAGEGAGQRTALWAVALAALHPLAIRVAAADTFWPYALACLWGAGLAALAALRSGRASDSLAAALLLGLAMTSNTVFMALAPLAILAPLAWRRGELRRLRPGAGALIAYAALAAFTGPYFVASLRHAFFGEGEALRSGAARSALSLVFENLYLDPRLTPIPLALALALGLITCARRFPRAAAPLLYAYVATDVVLASMVDLFTGYPTRFIHGFASLHLLALFAAVGIERFGAALGRVRLAHAASAITIAALVPTASESMAFLRGRRSLGAELRELSRAFERLPPHDVLVLPPVVQPGLPCRHMNSDPVEAFFPLGEYGYVLARRGLPLARVRSYEEWMADPARDEGRRVLFYLGSTYRTFLKCELQSGSVPDSLERPTLEQIRRAFKLEPELLFKLPATDHPAVAMRLGADRLPEVEAGFYWLYLR